MDNLLRYLKSGHNTVLSYDKKTGKHFNKQIFRHYISLGKIPKFDPNHPKSYMFHGAEGAKQFKDLPSELLEIITDIKNRDSRYNQFVVNLYEDGSEYIEPHSDCDKDMIENYSILIKSLGATRTMRFTKRTDHTLVEDIELKHDSIIEISKDRNKTTRHEILPSNTNEPRISITARMMK